MSRTYADPIDVRRAGGPPPLREAHPAAGVAQGGPAQFLWRGRLYVVRAVISHWIESSVWWGGHRRALEGALPAHEHEVWRVEAQAGRSDAAGVYELRRDMAADRWVLARAMD